MPNETLVNIPIDVAEPTSLRKFLTKLIEELDLVLGLRGGDKYVAESALIGSDLTLVSLATGITALESAIGNVAEALGEAEEKTEANTTTIAELDDFNISTVLSSTYHDFDNVAYSTLSGRSEFNTLGSDLTNAPYTPVGGETYYNYFNNIVTANGGVVQELKAFSSSTLVPTSYFRIGNTWTEAQTLGWT